MSGIGKSRPVSRTGRDGTHPHHLPTPMAAFHNLRFESRHSAFSQHRRFCAARLVSAPGLDRVRTCGGVLQRAGLRWAAASSP
jgi:hypothetical protein